MPDDEARQLLIRDDEARRVLMPPGGTGAVPAPLPAAPRPSFWELSVPASTETSEGLTNFLWEQGALGVVEEESPGEPPRLRAFFPEDRSPTKLLAAVDEYRAALGALGLVVAGVTEIRPLLDAAWASAWQQSFPPREIGERLVVLPPWTERPPSSRIAVVVEPGRAFGTGHHGSTEGCLALLDAEASRWSGGPAAPRRVLDLGTGTGILAIAAVKLGAPRVRAIDIDPDAVAAVHHNAALNDCAGAIEPALEGIESAADAPFDLVLANLLTHTHLALAAAYAQIVASGGALVLGGMLDGEDAEVVERLRPAGFSPDGRVVVEGWSSVLLRRAHGR